VLTGREYEKEKRKGLKNRMVELGDRMLALKIRASTTQQTYWGRNQ